MTMPWQGPAALILLAATGGALAADGAANAAKAGALPVVTASAATAGAPTAYDGVVESRRQTALAAQVSGAVLALAVQVGDRVKAGQWLVRLDARSAEQGAAAGEAQARVARAALEVADKELARQRQLAADRFISAAALDRAEAEFKAAQAQSAALLAQAAAARTTSAQFTIRAPYDGIVSELPVAQGDMAMPGRVLVVIYDPLALRVSAAVPQSAAGAIGDGRGVRIELPAAVDPAQRQQSPQRVQVLPAADAATHTLTIRADLAPPRAAPQAPPPVPGQFARLWLPAAVGGAEGGRPGAAAAAAVWVPAGAVVRRSEMTGLYVLDSAGRALLRQVRLGAQDGARVQVLSGLASGEQVVTDPQAAARAAAAPQPGAASR